jgi:hypothetical protein
MFSTQMAIVDVIDHDRDPISWLRHQLDEKVEIFVFPAVDTSPIELVSNQLIGAVLACDGMITFRRGASERSAWVAFERDYALRAKKPVYNLDPTTKSLSKIDLNQQTPLQLPIYPHAMSGSNNVVQIHNRMDNILGFMRDQRYFGIYGKRVAAFGGVEGVLKAGGYIVQFRGNTSNRQHEIVDRIIAHKYPDLSKIILALLEDCPLPNWIDSNSPSLIRLYQEDMPTEINNNRIDDLIVRLYWLIFRNQFPELVYE